MRVCFRPGRQAAKTQQVQTRKKAKTESGKVLGVFWTLTCQICTSSFFQQGAELGRSQEETMLVCEVGKTAWSIKHHDLFLVPAQ